MMRTQLLSCAAAAAFFVLSPSADAQVKLGDSSQSAAGRLSALGYVDGGQAKAPKPKKAVKQKRKESALGLDDLAKLIQQLETGRAALEQIGEEKQAKQMAKLIKKAKAKYEAAEKKKRSSGRQLGMDARGMDARAMGTNGMDMSDLGMRMRAVAVARDFYAEREWGTAARQLGALLECGKLIQEGADGDKIMEAYAGAPDIDERIEMLDRAAASLKQNGNSDRAMLCAALSKWYVGKRDTIVAPGAMEPPVRPQAGVSPEVAPKARALSLEKRADRVAILGFARDAHLAGGSREAADKLGALMRLGKLQESGASDAELAAATPQDVSMPELVEYVRQAAPVLSKSGNAAKARACEALAEFYTKRDGLAGGASTDRGPSEPGQPMGTFRFDSAPPPPRAPRAADSIEARIDALQRQIEELRRSVAEMRGGQGRR